MLRSCGFGAMGGELLLGYNIESRMNLKNINEKKMACINANNNHYVYLHREFYNT